MSFSALGLSAPVLQALAGRGFTEPTPIQSAAIPVVLRGADVWASAQTGSGKTAAFALPLIERLIAEGPRGRGRFVRVLILVPTRELAVQIAGEIQDFSAHLAQGETLKTLVAVGGVSINPQMMALGGGADFIVATPGRLLDLIDHNAVSLAQVSALVLDEADRLFALGFADELGRIVSLLPARRQTLLFSATFPPPVRALAESLLRDPARIDIAATPEGKPDIVQRAFEVDVPMRTQLLRNLIELNGWTRVLVFVATKYATEHVAEKLNRAGIASAALHGEQSQGARTRALTDFKASRVRVLVATDVASRGIDIESLPVVVNYDLPRSPADYTHRIGRTGRAGESGVAVSFITAETDAHFRLIEKRNKLSIEREQLPGLEPVETIVPAPPPAGGIKGRRKSKKDKLREAAGLPPTAPAPKPAKAADAVKRPGTAEPTEYFSWNPRTPQPRRR